MAKFDVNEELVRKLADLLHETGLTEIEYEIDDHRIRVAKTPAVASYAPAPAMRSEEHTSELQSLMRISYAVFCLKKKKIKTLDNKTTKKHKKRNNMH